MNCATLASPATTFTLTGPGTTAVAGTVSCAGSTATFTPAADLAVNTIYTATITTGAQSTAGMPLGGQFRVDLQNGSGCPSRSSNGHLYCARQRSGRCAHQPGAHRHFQRGDDSNHDQRDDIHAEQRRRRGVTGVVTYVAAGSVAIFKPVANLLPSTVYTATITTGAMDLAGTGLAQNYVWTFTTSAAAVVTAPTVTSTIPLNGATGVPLNQIVSATFSTAMNPATINSATFSLTGPGATAVTGLVAYAAVGNTLTFTPAANLAAEHPVYSHDHHRRSESRRHRAGRQLCVDVYDRSGCGSNRAGDRFDDSGERCHRRGFESGCQRNLHRSDESADHHNGDLPANRDPAEPR